MEARGMCHEGREAPRALSRHLRDFMDLEALGMMAEVPHMNDVEMKNMSNILRIYEDFMDLEAWRLDSWVGVLPPCCQRSHRWRPRTDIPAQTPPSKIY